MTANRLSWLGIVRLGLVQTALGAIVVLTTSTLNRVMVVELGFLATLPGALVAFHYAVQILRPRWGYGSDGGRRRTPWIIGGMAILALGGVTAAAATALMAQAPVAGIALAVFAFFLIGIGVGASGTSLLVLLATSVAPERRAPAASIVWMMMIAGFIVTTITAGSLLDPFTLSRLIAVTAGVCAVAFLVSVIAVWGIEGSLAPQAEEPAKKPPFLEALSEVWGEPRARQFTIFVFLSMLAYSAQDLILEPFAGLVFEMTPGQSTKLTGFQNMGVLLGMIVVAIAGSSLGRGRFGSLRAWTSGGCLGSALALAALAFGGRMAPSWPLEANVFALGFANGAFAVAAIGSMMCLANEGRESREGVRMGLWGAAQGIAFGLGGFIGTVAVDFMRTITADPIVAYGAVFVLEAALFVVAAIMAARIEWAQTRKSEPVMFSAGKSYLAGAGGG